MHLRVVDCRHVADHGVVSYTNRIQEIEGTSACAEGSLVITIFKLLECSKDGGMCRQRPELERHLKPSAGHQLIHRVRVDCPKR